MVLKAEPRAMKVRRPVKKVQPLDCSNDDSVVENINFENKNVKDYNLGSYRRKPVNKALNASEKIINIILEYKKKNPSKSIDSLLKKSELKKSSLITLCGTIGKSNEMYKNDVFKFSDFEWFTFVKRVGKYSSIKNKDEATALFCTLINFILNKDSVSYSTDYNLIHYTTSKIQASFNVYFKKNNIDMDAVFEDGFDIILANLNSCLSKKDKSAIDKQKSKVEAVKKILSGFKLNSENQKTINEKIDPILSATVEKKTIVNDGFAWLKTIGRIIKDKEKGGEEIIKYLLPKLKEKFPLDLLSVGFVVDPPANSWNKKVEIDLLSLAFKHSNFSVIHLFLDSGVPIWQAPFDIVKSNPFRGLVYCMNKKANKKSGDLNQELFLKIRDCAVRDLISGGLDEKDASFLVEKAADHVINVLKKKNQSHTMAAFESIILSGIAKIGAFRAPCGERPSKKRTSVRL